MSGVIINCTGSRGWFAGTGYFMSGVIRNCTGYRGCFG